MPTQTLLTAVNETLLNIGESRQGDLSSAVGVKGRLAMQKAIRFVGMLHNWRYLSAVISTANWVNDYAQLVPIQNLYEVTLDQQVLRSVPEDTLYGYAARTAFTPSVAPQYYSLTGQGVRVYPSPLTIDKPRVLFRVLLLPQVPQLAADNFTIPDDIYDAIQTYAEMLLHRNHTTDIAAMQACASDFELRIHMLRSRHTSQTVSNMGMLT